MTFEKIIKNLSALVAGVLVFLLAGGMYLSTKGFEMDEQGNIILMRQANAQEDELPAELPEIPDNYIFPNAHIIGSDKAPISLYEYSSFGCSHCADFHLNVLPKLKEKYIDKGILKLVFVPFPIDKSSMNAALLAECLPADKYFSFADVMYKKQREWGLSRNPDKVLKQYAALSGLNAAKADACLKDDDEARENLLNRQNGITQLGIQGTPSFVISHHGKSELLSGALSLETMEKLIDSRMAD